MKVDVLLGLQWGDEGKGKIVDFLSPKYDIIARFQGGPNAGHTLEFDNHKHILHTIPSGIFHKNVINIIGNGVVIDPVILKNELHNLKNYNINFKNNLLISRRAHLILPTHKIIDKASEKLKGKSKIGSTLKGIGPTYMDKTGRNGLKIGDIELKNFKNLYTKLKDKHLKIIEFYDYSEDLKLIESEWFESINYIKTLNFIDSEHFLNNSISQNKKILAEGAQGSLLDIDFGTYPFVTSSNTISAGACTGLGIPPNKIGKIFGIFKAYLTRVGSGPFPTEQDNDIGEKMKKNGNEFGSTTGRSRRCGWIDIPALKYAIKINGVSELMLMKSDVLSKFPYINVCTGYKYKNKLIDYFPYSIDKENIQPVYQKLNSWDKNIQNINVKSDLPKEALKYVEFLENTLKIPISIISVGPNRNQTIINNFKT